MSAAPTASPTGSPTLRDLVAAHRGAPTSKWAHYLDVYDQYLTPFRGKSVSLLEIGVFQGGSLEIWRKYLGPNARLYGVDVDPACANLDAGGAEIIIGDQADRRFLESLLQRLPTLDVVIDDGGHHAAQQISTFEALYPHVNERGLYIVEDLHTSYWSKFGGGFGEESFVERAKRMVDHLHQWFWYNSDVRSFRGRGSANLPTEPLGPFARETKALHFYNSMLVIEKGKAERPWWGYFGEEVRTE